MTVKLNYREFQRMNAGKLLSVLGEDIGLVYVDGQAMFKVKVISKSDLGHDSQCREVETGDNWINKKCQICGYTGVYDVHHKDSQHTNNTPNNLIILCPTCHAKVHRRGISLDRDTQRDVPFDSQASRHDSQSVKLDSQATDTDRLTVKAKLSTAGITVDGNRIVGVNRQPAVVQTEKPPPWYDADRHTTGDTVRMMRGKKVEVVTL